MPIGIPSRVGFPIISPDMPLEEIVEEDEPTPMPSPVPEPKRAKHRISKAVKKRQLAIPEPTRRAIKVARLRRARMGR